MRWHLAAFSLVELLTVMAIVGVLAAIAAPALSAISGNEVSRASYSVSDVLNEARTYAMSKSTYVYVGLVEDASSSASGKMVIGVVASSEGTQMFTSTNSALTSSSNSFNPISKLLEVTNIQATSLPASSTEAGMQRQVVPSSDKLGDPSFGQGNPTYSFSVGSYVFSSVPGVSSAQGVSSVGMLQIDPQGVVSEVGGYSVPFFEIGLAPVHGNQSNYAAVQIAGLSGTVRVYRP